MYISFRGIFSFTHPFNSVQGDNAQYKPRVFNSSAEVSDPTLKVSTIVTGLNFPTNMAFLGKDDILVTEKNTGTIRRIISGYYSTRSNFGSFGGNYSKNEEFWELLYLIKMRTAGS